MPLSFAFNRTQLVLILTLTCPGLRAFAAEPAAHPSSSASNDSPSIPIELPSNRFRPIDMFELETATDPRISPDGAKVVFVRNFNDIMKDRKRSNLWIINSDGSDLRPLTSGNENDNSPQWSPDGKRLLYVSSGDGSSQIYVRWMDSGQTAKVTRCPKAPGGMEWSRDGKWIAFSMPVPDETKPFVEMPAKPEGAEWAKAPKAIRRMIYRTDEEGYLEEVHKQLFVVPAEGGTPHQLTHGGYDHEGPFSWSPDGKTVILSWAT